MDAPQEGQALPTGTAAGFGSPVVGVATGDAGAAGAGAGTAADAATGSPRALFSACRAMLRAPP